MSDATQVMSKTMWYRSCLWWNKVTFPTYGKSRMPEILTAGAFLKA